MGSRLRKHACCTSHPGVTLQVTLSLCHPVNAFSGFPNLPGICRQFILHTSPFAAPSPGTTPWATGYDRHRQVSIPHPRLFHGCAHPVNLPASFASRTMVQNRSKIQPTPAPLLGPPLSIHPANELSVSIPPHDTTRPSVRRVQYALFQFLSFWFPTRLSNLRRSSSVLCYPFERISDIFPLDHRPNLLQQHLWAGLPS